MNQTTRAGLKRWSLFLIIAVVVGGFCFAAQPPKNQIIFYYGEECPHCHNVLKFIADNQIDQKIKIETKEVYHQTQNQRELAALAKICPEIIDSSGNIGVPVALITREKKCLQGDTAIIEKIKTIMLQ
ncbi:MAG TPA: hypothetical protein PK131_01650 [Candidatus Woesebacteria bacterium]|nr:hypothetical protein [Candidatus Woesebacteria bacterium]HRT39921.1 hypothetical protein [Candidatus Woesebacteria bacterium]